MSVGHIVRETKMFFEECKSAQKKVVSGSSKNINSHDERELLEALATKWFSDFSKVLPMYGVLPETMAKYNDAFKTILKLASGPNRRETFKKQIEIITSAFNVEIIIYLQTDAEEPEDSSHTQFQNEVQELLSKIPDHDENEYLQEALGCWEAGFLKGATVLLWCAAIDRIHKVIEGKGFSVFNQTCEFMRAQTTGKYKRFNKVYSVQSLSDLRTVFDSEILLILEAMQLIDSNERTRLVSCFDMRCHSGHPGAAPITKYNVLSCFSDVIEIVLSNPKFLLK